jgi:Tfp pilus assembly protein PilF
VIERGFAEFMHATDRMRADVAVKLAEALHGRAGAVWSAQNLAIAYTRQGSYQAGSSCLIKALEGDMNQSDRSMLQSRLSLVYWGAGGFMAARSVLGASLCQGNSDSGIVLGLSSLERGRFDRAKTLFRSVLGHDSSQPWARKGWGLSMLPH